MLAFVGSIILLFVVAFLLGSIPWGVIVSRLFFRKDIRTEGSGNIGATNAVRSLGLGGGAAVFVLDVLKGVAAGALGYFVWATWLVDGFTTESIILLTAIKGNVVAANGALYSSTMHVFCAGVAFLGCVLGHVFCPWLRFHGGKGISVAFGCLFFVMGPAGALIELAVFAVFVAVTRYVSVGSVAAAVACPFLAVWMCWGCWPAIVFVAVAALVVIWAHRANISRLLKGEEPRFGQKEGSSRQLEKQVEDLRPRRERREEERRAKKAKAAAPAKGVKAGGGAEAGEASGATGEETA